MSGWKQRRDKRDKPTAVVCGKAEGGALGQK